MNTKRLWIALLTIPVCLISVLIIGAQRSHPANAGGVIDPTCVSSLPCIEYDNNGSGPGIRGVSLTGNGSNGITRVNSTSAATGREGVFGNDMSTSGSFNSGVRGLSTRGTGVLGNSTIGPGISGVSTSGTGVTAQSTSGFGMQGVSSTAIGVQGISSKSDAVQGVIGSGVAASFHSGVAGLDLSTSGTTNAGVYGQSTNGIAMQALSFNFIGAQVSGGADNGSTLNPALSVNSSGSELIAACGSGGPNPCRTFPFGIPQFQVFDNGNVKHHGPASHQRLVHARVRGHGIIWREARSTVYAARKPSDC